MNGSDPKLLVHVKFDSISRGKVLDATGQGRDGVVHGDPKIVPDDRLGGCLAFGGGADAIELPASCYPGGAGVTISFWAPGGLSSAAASLFGALGRVTQVENMAGAIMVAPPGTVSFTCGASGRAPDVISRSVTADEARAAWAHWAFTRDAAGHLTIYRDGAAWQTATVPPAPIPAATGSVWLGSQVGGGNAFAGKLAGFRIYGQAQTPVQIARDIQADQSAVAAFRRSYPLDFGVHNDQMQRVLYITDDPAGHPMHVHVTNASGQVIRLVAPAAGATAGPDSYHFAVRFRPGTLSASFLATAPASLRAAVQPLGWDAALGHAPDGTDSLYFLATAGAALGVDRSVELTVPNLSADGTGGARGTRVLLDFRGLAFEGDPTPVVGSRTSYLSVLNQTGAEQAPLHAGFVGDGDLLNDGSTKTNLRLRITNTSPDRPLTFNPTDSAAPTRLILAFDVQGDHEVKEWALATSSQAAAVVPQPRGPGEWDWRADTAGQTAEWILTPKAPVTLAPGDAFRVVLTGVSSSLPAGEASLYVRYQNLPGYWDGELVVTVTKTPIVCTPQGNVGVGINAPEAKLHVKGGHLRVDGGEFQSSGPIVLHPDVDRSGDGIVRFVNNAGQETMRVDATGDVGIGTASPTAKLTVSAGDAHAQFRREAPAAPGGDLLRAAVAVPGGPTVPPTAATGTVLFLELFQDDPKAAVPPVFPAIRFHHSNRFWHRVEARPEGIHLKTGDTKSDAHVDVYAATAHLDGSVTLGAANAIQQGVNFQVAAGTPFKSNGNGNWQASWTTGGALRIVGEAGGVLATKDRDVLLWKPDDHDPALGNVLIKGSLWARDKYFLIAHPTDPDRDLVHACLEGPESAVFYRGEGRLRDGRATIRLPEYFEALTRKEGRTVMLTAKGVEPYLLSYEDIEDGAFRVHGTKLDGAFSWEVKAVRADVDRLQVEVAR